MTEEDTPIMITVIYFLYEKNSEDWDDGWFVVDFKTKEKLSGPHDSFAAACDALHIRVYCLRQGWKP